MEQDEDADADPGRRPRSDFGICPDGTGVGEGRDAGVGQALLTCPGRGAACNAAPQSRDPGDGPRISSAPRRKCGALRSIREAPADNDGKLTALRRSGSGKTASLSAQFVLHLRTILAGIA